jgi:hypothetical protein
VDTVADNAANWPALPVRDWQATRDTVHLWTQVVGKIRLALAPSENHWWNVPLYVNAVGLTTSLMPYRGIGVEMARCQRCSTAALSTGSAATYRRMNASKPAASASSGISLCRATPAKTRLAR